MIYDKDPYLQPYKDFILSVNHSINIKKQEIAGYEAPIKDSVNNYLYYALRCQDDKLIFREWAPNATKVYLIGDFNNWERRQEYALQPIGDGNWELSLPASLIPDKSLYKWYIEWNGGSGERIPTYAYRVVQDDASKVYSAQVWLPKKEYKWKRGFRKQVRNPLIYEAHIGMSSEEEKVSTFNEFRLNVLPRVIAGGYNVLQLMALQEHPYYGSFGYQVSSFFALSSRFGTPEEFKRLVDDAHKGGVAVVMDIVHSHSVDNVVEGLSMFDGREDLYFHLGNRGRHPAWGSRCFNYGKDSVIHFLLSNVKFWMEEYHLDGFRFDGVTSMLYHDHGLERDFTDYSCYYNDNQDKDAVVYLALANILIKEINPLAITIAEDMSGLPGLAAPLSQGGIGFDFRMSMGVADHWIKWIKELKDEDWDMGNIYYELSNKRDDEKTISYAECHDQAMVGDKTIIFRLIDKEMYFSMNKESQNLLVDRGIALHKMIRLLTIVTAGNGYLNFMGNEFGNPEWIDFPREGNNWSYKYARRQWSLAENEDLRYSYLLDFDRDMVRLFNSEDILSYQQKCLVADNLNHILVISRGSYIFAFNFNANNSYTDYCFNAPDGKYKIVIDSDLSKFGGFSRINDDTEYFSTIYLPARTAIVLKKLK